MHPVFILLYRYTVLIPSITHKSRNIGTDIKNFCLRILCLKSIIPHNAPSEPPRNDNVSSVFSGIRRILRAVVLELRTAISLSMPYRRNAVTLISTVIQMYILNKSLSSNITVNLSVIIVSLYKEGRGDTRPSGYLLEVLNAVFKDLLILLTGNILAYTNAFTLGVSHFTEYSAVR